MAGRRILPLLVVFMFLLKKVDSLVPLFRPSNQPRQLPRHHIISGKRFPETFKARLVNGVDTCHVRRALVEDEEEGAPKVAEKGRLYFTIWACIYFSCFIVVYGQLGALEPWAEERFEWLDPVGSMEALCDWLDARVTNVAWITSRLRGNPGAAEFTSAYLLTDLVPTTLLAGAAYPFVQRRIKKMNTKDSEKS
mmetsp:Transcript_65626/g.148100  ORF Transcript_65626/g.148100 Transcript_65626/m.148100 type:complete len:194 (+) Transcript_65626:112-693(+)